MAVIGSESYTHWINIWLAVISLYFNVVTNAARMTRWSNYSAKTYRNT